jgi:hypothetical protein
VTAPHADVLPKTLAARFEFATEMLLGPVIVDEDGRPTGERGAPLITREQYLEMVGT